MSQIHSGQASHIESQIQVSSPHTHIGCMDSFTLHAQAPHIACIVAQTLNQVTVMDPTQFIALSQIFPVKLPTYCQIQVSSSYTHMDSFRLHVQAPHKELIQSQSHSSHLYKLLPTQFVWPHIHSDNIHKLLTQILYGHKVIHTQAPPHLACMATDSSMSHKLPTCSHILSGHTQAQLIFSSKRYQEV